MSAALALYELKRQAVAFLRRTVSILVSRDTARSPTFKSQWLSVCIFIVENGHKWPS
jgi:hypothetical protein